MSTHELPSNIGMYLRLVWVAGLISLAAAGGYLVGDLSIGDDGPPPIVDRGGYQPRTAAAGLATDGSGLPEVDVPVWFFVRPTTEGDWSAAMEEVKLAAANGVHRYAILQPLPWDGAEGVSRTLQILDQILVLNPDARILLELDLNPPPAWQRTHSQDVVQVDGQFHIYPSMGSRIWLSGVQSALTSLITGLHESPTGSHVEGFILAALENGRWYRSGGYDQSEVNREGFRAWLGRHYGDDAALRAAWGDTGASFDTVEVPAMPEATNPVQVFFRSAEERRQVDYLRYVSESTADNIAAITAHIKGNTKTNPIVLANYGYSFEFTESGYGHFALGSLVASDLDGFVSPVSYIDRGLGGSGGVMGPVHSALSHGKMWIVVDDTRTGLSRNNSTNTVERIKGIHPQDVYSVQLRNFGSAMVQGLGVGWMDPEGQGWLQDAAQWEFFGKLSHVYARCLAEGKIRPLSEEAVLPESPPQDTIAEAAADSVPLPFEVPNRLTVVLDESSRFYQKAGAVVNSRLLHQVRDAALRAGVPVHFALLQDVLDGTVPNAGVYLFANLFHLDQAERERLHAHLAATHAAAIWMYAPGYIADGASTKNIEETVRMQVKEFQKKRMGGSRYLLSGAWVKQNEQIGQEQEWDPLFYISDETVDVVAEYVASDEASIAVRFMDDWTSIFVAEPAMTAGLLRELIEILEQHLYFRTTAQSQFDTMYLGNEMLVLHAAKAGDRVLDFGRYFDVADLVDTDYGWNQKHTFVLNMEAGETRLLGLYPLGTQAPKSEEAAAE